MPLSIALDLSWPALNTTGICAAQTLNAAGTLIFNGILTYFARPDASNRFAPRLASFGNVVRVVSLTSTSNLSGVNFTITGYFNGLPVSQTIAGPNNNTVETTQLYQIVNSVSADAGFSPNDVSVGSGSTGQTVYVGTNLSGGYYIVQEIVTNNGGSITFEGRATGENMTNVANFNNASNYQIFQSSGSTSTIGQPGTGQYFWFAITASSGGAVINMKATFFGLGLYNSL